MANPIRLNDDGTVTLTLGSEPVTLRRPKIGEMRQFRQALRDNDAEMQARLDVLQGELDALTARAAAHAERMKELPDDWDGEDEATEAAAIKAEDQRLRRLIQEVTEDRLVAWFLDVVGTLSTRKIAAADAEAWMAQPELPASLTSHWQTVPFGSGESSVS